MSSWAFQNIKLFVVQVKNAGSRQQSDSIIARTLFVIYCSVHGCGEKQTLTFFILKTQTLKIKNIINRRDFPRKKLGQFASQKFVVRDHGIVHCKLGQAQWRSSYFNSLCNLDGCLVMALIFFIFPFWFVSFLPPLCPLWPLVSLGCPYLLAQIVKLSNVTCSPEQPMQNYL